MKFDDFIESFIGHLYVRLYKLPLPKHSEHFGESFSREIVSFIYLF